MTSQNLPTHMTPNPQEPEDGVSIVIPAYNEELGIAGVLQELLEMLDTLPKELPIEVIVVDDGSKDKTSEELKPFEGERLRALRHPKNRGYGASLKTGIQQARYPWILITDADGTYPNKHIPELLEHRHENDMVVGARIGENTNIPLIRRPPKWVLRKLASYLSHRDIPDLNSGLRLMRKSVVKQFLHILPDGFSFTTTITLATLSTGCAVKYVPIDYLKRKGSSKIRPIADTLNFVKLILRTSMYFDPLRVFVPIAALFFIASFGVGFGSWILTDQLMDVSTVVLFVTGVQMLVLGMFADMLNYQLKR